MKRNIREGAYAIPIFTKESNGRRFAVLIDLPEEDFVGVGKSEKVGFNNRAKFERLTGRMKGIFSGAKDAEDPNFVVTLIRETDEEHNLAITPDSIKNTQATIQIKQKRGKDQEVVLFEAHGHTVDLTIEQLKVLSKERRIRLIEIKRISHIINSLHLRPLAREALNLYAKQQIA